MADDVKTTSSHSPGRDRSAIAFAIGFPSLVTWLYFVALAGQSAGLQQGTYTVLKIVQFAFPAVWVFVVQREKFALTPPTLNGLAWGLGLGLLVAASMLLMVRFWLEPIGFFDLGEGGATARSQIETKIRGLGVDSLAKYGALAMFYAICHSLLEEYYWRWFVFARLKPYTSVTVAILVSSVGFMAHHVIVLATFFGWTSPVTYLFSLAVAIGGGLWAWIYQRSGSIYGPWLSHLLVDAAIFIVGYQLVGTALS